MKKNLPCPWLRCRNGARGLWVAIGRSKKVVYVRRRDKDEHGPRYNWEKTDLKLADLYQTTPDTEKDDIVF